MNRFLLLLLGLASLLVSCGGDKAARPKTQELQSDAGAALLQYVVDQCPRIKDVKGWNLCIGEAMTAPEEPFRQRLNVPGIPYVPHRNIQVGILKGRRTIFDSETGASPLTLQISSLTEPVDGRQEGVAAWAWMDEAHRARYELTLRDGKWTVRQLEEMSVPPINTGEAVTPEP